MANGDKIYPMNIYGGLQLESKESMVVPTDKINPADNGMTYIVSSLSQTPMKSVYSAMGEQAASEDAPYYQFYKLMKESNAFVKDDTYAMSDDWTVDVFNTYHYTIYVPSNDSVLAAIKHGLPTIEQANEFVKENNLTSAKKEEYLDSIRAILHDFVCYHIHDNSVYIGGTEVKDAEYQTGTMNMDERVFRRVRVNADYSSLTVVDGAGRSHSVEVIPENEGIYYNLMTRDYLFNDGDTGGKVDEKDSNISNSKCIETSSFAVIHAIDDVLLYDNAQLEAYKIRVAQLQEKYKKK